MLLHAIPLSRPEPTEHVEEMENSIYKRYLFIFHVISKCKKNHIFFRAPTLLYVKVGGKSS
jgi:hypothetical protein